MLTIEQLRVELGKLTFWPNYHFAVFAHPFRGPVVRIVFSVPDSNDMRQTVVIGNTHNVPSIALRSARDFHEWLLDELKHKAIHETVEAYRVDGVPLHDPHGPDWSELATILMDDPHIDCARWLWMTGLAVAVAALTIYIGTR